ncbi:MAG: glutamate--tRNA ligase [Candidatus Tokpelaia sp.]|uniref:glutamate--tRNA ligase n=1 Tax=Candidatus Tokpelaia sp. TaxID=2233777 RepID=UPI0012392491|nr:glutamate--tRNA ligase [Candidatus Tokpelaia sp.]KAA6205604.1 MAG: glutamate--tRNA ligase [Candidatus Tokpelaia sp.]KAA6207795.1 MAG: glutamate--tRNA ligase [Candidatus Tokpelaia sp.]KAA6404990.1 glutamate--tRNA ligase [Candidatus Tokpelaia sp.]
MIRVRFAPSPTGYIHIGNTRIALFNWLFALQHRGGKIKGHEKQSQFILRYDDTDSGRSRQEYIDAIAEDIAWLGIKPDEIYFQSARFERYGLVSDSLREVGLLYPCYETAEELERRRKIRLSRKLPPVYGREALKLTEAEKKAYAAEGRKPHWRFLLPNYDGKDPFAVQRSEVHWLDSVRGRQTVDLASVSDPVLVRADGTYLYTLPSVVDDMDMGVSHIIRGDDHITNTGVQIALFNALGAALPVFGHVNLLTSATGEGLSKRKGDLSVRSLREAGFEPMAIASLAVLTGTSENLVAYNSLAELSGHFSLAAVSRSAARFDPADLLNLNGHLMRHLPYEQAAAALAGQGIKGDKAKAFWAVIRNNIDKLSDASVWWPLITDKAIKFIPASYDEATFLQKAAELLPLEPWNHESCGQWIGAIKQASSRKGKELFKPLRHALTGRDSGPELADLLPLMGRELVFYRLTGGNLGK